MRHVRDKRVDVNKWSEDNILLFVWQIFLIFVWSKQKHNLEICYQLRDYIEYKKYLIQ